MAAESDAIFLKNCWYVAAWDHELIDGTKLARTLLENPVVVYRAKAAATRWATTDVSACVTFDITATTTARSGSASSDITRPPTSSPSPPS